MGGATVAPPISMTPSLDDLRDAGLERARPRLFVALPRVPEVLGEARPREEAPDLVGGELAQQVGEKGAAGLRDRGVPEGRAVPRHVLHAHGARGRVGPDG